MYIQNNVNLFVPIKSEEIVGANQDEHDLNDEAISILRNETEHTRKWIDEFCTKKKSSNTTQMIQGMYVLICIKYFILFFQHNLYVVLYFTLTTFLHHSFSTFL